MEYYRLDEKEFRSPRVHRRDEKAQSWFLIAISVTMSIALCERRGSLVKTLVTLCGCVTNRVVSTAVNYVFACEGRGTLVNSRGIVRHDIL